MHAMMSLRATRHLSPLIRYRAKSNLAVLADIISKNAANLEKVGQNSSTPLPDLDEPFHPATEAFRQSPEAAESAAQIVAASLQLAATLSSPMEALYHVAAGPFKGAALRVSIEANVAEILREAGPGGLHVNEISKQNGQDPKKLARFLRYLATNHIFQEVEPDVFRNNRLSGLLDTGKDSKAILADPDAKFDGTTGVTAIVSHHLDEITKASVYAWEHLNDPEAKEIQDQRGSPMAKYLGKGKNQWEWFEQPDQLARRKRFDMAMKGAAALQSADAIRAGFDWAKLPKGATVVDVGGGIGFAAASVCDGFPDLHYVVQDLPGAIANAKDFWAERHPKAVQNNGVAFEAHSFLEPQPKRDVSVFFVKHIVHGFTDTYSKKILDHLRASATPSTSLVLPEFIVPHACRLPVKEKEARKNIPGSIDPEAPEPLLANYGSQLAYGADMAMMFGPNGQERTYREMDALLSGSGWRIVKVHRQGGQMAVNFYEAVPV